mmetsp:Transcript_9455/g.19941  ORF Transcript_9455/g.19941 Transcript_9455/m.19941 type:complete len:375 (+) Transcript_9455:25-1149(+)
MGSAASTAARAGGAGASSRVAAEVGNHAGSNVQHALEGVSVRVRHILLGSERDAQRALGALAKHSSSRAVQGSDRFEDIAREFSKCPSGKQAGGLLGWIKPGQLVRELELEVFRMRKHDIDVLPSRHGIHIVQILDRVEQGTTAHKAPSAESGPKRRPDQTNEYFELLKAVSCSIRSKEWDGVIPQGGLVPSDVQRTSDHSSARTARTFNHLPKPLHAPVDSIPAPVEGKLNQLQLRKLLAEAANAVLLDVNDSVPQKESREATKKAIDSIHAQLSQKFGISILQVRALLQHTAIFDVVKTQDGSRFAVWNDDNHDLTECFKGLSESQSLQDRGSHSRTSRMSSFRALAGELRTSQPESDLHHEPHEEQVPTNL